LKKHVYSKREQAQKACFFFALLFSFFIFFPNWLRANQQMNVSRNDISEWASSPQWLNLLHYESSGKAYKSVVDDPKFFFAKDGKTRPDRELESFIAKIQSDPEVACLFPARFKFLKKRLPQLQKSVCVELTDWFERLKPKSVTLVFASYYLSSPASVFGHTLLRINSMKREVHADMLDYGVNYAAEVDTQNDFLYAIKGLFGFFKGSFSIYPYSKKVEEYNNMDSRDIWEYELNLVAEELEMLVLHIWEMGHTYADYYFFDENCSYFLLRVLEAAKPELQLSKQFTFSAIPIETVKAITQVTGLVKSRVLRPSIRSKIESQLNRLTAADRTLALRALEERSIDQIESASETSKIEILDLLAEIIEYRRLQSQQEAERYKDFRWKVLNRRSQFLSLETKSEPAALEAPPEEIHESKRLTLGALTTASRAVGIEVSFTPSFHNIFANETAFRPFSNIEILKSQIAFNSESGKVNLSSFTVLDMWSLAEISAVFKPLSWKFSTGIEQSILSDCTDCHRLFMKTSLGGSTKIFSKTLMYGLFDTEVFHSSIYDSKSYSKIGPTVGIFYDPSMRWRMNFSQQLHYALYGKKYAANQSYIEQESFFLIRYSWNVNQDLAFSYSFLKDDVKNFTTSKINYGIYF
jgi:hypothetical protein